MFNLIYLIHLPYINSRINYIEIFNELCILINLIILAQVLNYEESPIVGVYINGILMINIIANMYFTLIDSWHGMKLFFKRVVKMCKKALLKLEKLL